MNLYTFLRKIRKEGVDLTNVMLRVPDWGLDWREGLPIVDLSGNRLTVSVNRGTPIRDSSRDITLSPGHSVLKCEVYAVVRRKLERVRKITDKPPAVILMLSPHLE